MEWLQKARSQSDSSKNKIALVAAGIITALIVGTWILILKNQKTPDSAVAKSKSSELKPLFMIFKSAKEDFQDIKANAKANKASSVDVLE
jgi:hypothetical protein